MDDPVAADAQACTVLLLDLHVRADGFIGDQTLSALAGRIAAAGHRARLVRRVAAEAPSAAQFLAGTAEAVRASGAEVVVLSRAWERPLLDAARAALLPGARLVRLHRGARSPLDDAFDLVLDADDLLALLAGEAPRAAAQRPTAASLRRSLAVAAPPPLDAAALARVEIEGDRGRPTISGPSGGCPYLADARRNPVFADLDPAKVQTRGCSFCLDNTGAYAAFPEATVVGAWLTQIRAARAASPGAGRLEVLLTDERPHPHLPAFFEALLTEPGLAPIELLWKSRVDWLLELAESAVAPACALAARSGSVLHLYLVGFESFDRGHLDLFNKGHGPEESEAAIEKMRELAGRFPESFEYRRYRAHGFLLFTPWTSPESLLENARWMRRVRFDELRSDALRTRLRLYPSVPLYHLAARDGLLTEQFEEGRGDRAAEQGYDASAPWRFRDGRTEAIFQLAQAIGESASVLPEADLIELATHFVLRRPGLAGVPALARLPFNAATDAWNAPAGFLVEALGPVGAGFDPEVEAIGVTDRRAALKEGVRASDAGDLAIAYRAMGLSSEVVHYHDVERSTGRHRGGGEHGIVAVAADGATLAEVLELQRVLAAAADMAAWRAATRRLGELMGYPACCVEAIVALTENGDNQALERLPFLRAPGERLDPLLHRAGLLRLISHHPCTPGCAPSAAQAGRVLARLGEASPEAASRARAALSAPSLFLDYDHILALEGAFTGSGAREVFALRGARSHGRGRGLSDAMASASWLRLAPDSVTIGFAGGRTQVVAARRPILAEPGRPLAPAALAAIALEAIAVRSAVPPLPALVRPGVRAGAYLIAATHKSASGYVITLAQGGERLSVRVRPHREGEPYTVRAGAWALELEAPGALADPARAAVGLLARALARG